MGETVMQEIPAHMGDTGCILVHGFTGTPWTFSHLSPELKQAHVAVSAPLLPGHGTEPQDLQNVQWQSWYKAVEEQYTDMRRQCRSVFIAGHSMGGALALLAGARLNPDGIISMSAPLRICMAKTAVLRLIHPFVSCIRKKASHTLRIKEAGYDCYPSRGVIECSKLLSTVRKELHQVNAPVLFMHSKEDRRVRFSHMARIEKRVSSSVTHCIGFSSSGHMLPVGPDKDKVSREIISFINRYSAEQATGAEGI